MRSTVVLAVVGGGALTRFVPPVWLARASGALDDWRRYRSLAAVRLGQLVTLDADKLNRHAPRMAEEIGALCERIDAARAMLAR